jgi:hypothetical protein
MFFNDRRNKKPLGKITGMKSKGLKNPRPATTQWSNSGNEYANRIAAGHGSENARTWGKPASEKAFADMPTEKNDGFRVIKPGSQPRTKGKSQ